MVCNVYVGDLRSILVRVAYWSVACVECWTGSVRRWNEVGFFQKGRIWYCTG